MSFPTSPQPGQVYVYNKKTYTWSSQAQYWFCEGTSHETGVDATVYMYDNVGPHKRTIKIADKLQDDFWAIIRENRDTRIAEVEWRYNRYYRNERLGLPQIDAIADLDAYVKSLTDITDQENPFELVWPVLDQSS